MGLLLLIWSLPALAITQIWGAGPAALILLYVLFICGLQIWSKKLYGYAQPLQHYGLEITQSNAINLCLGLAIGGLSLGLMLNVEALFGWLTWRQPPGLSVALTGLGVAIAVGFAEELLFRGWLLDELERDYSPNLALLIGSAIFAALHYIKPWSEIVQNWPQAFGLFLLGITLVWSKRGCRGRLGLAIGLHAGLVWAYYCVDVGNWLAYTGLVPAWITGINENPLAGLMGLLCLSSIALNIRYWTTRKTFQKRP
ncbi:hypothetical protein C1752_03413 [Acaryochloris thomasi RCC1774]|uniref:CAAX prenyl protease 2/Lysostaphin resistance protein A-like domain-containing protein n=2 Tax=Acaryochloris TaxID=155977 RepID=A0A2W1JG96_9CYAN|nr:hypothetical protein C1752_03413 [Acaryochloris thomasi RCC1774]